MRKSLLLLFLFVVLPYNAFAVNVDIRVPCNSTTDCIRELGTTELECVGGFCSFLADTWCNNDGDCNKGQSCINNRCVDDEIVLAEECENDNDCTDLPLLTIPQQVAWNLTLNNSGTCFNGTCEYLDTYKCNVGYYRTGAATIPAADSCTQCPLDALSNTYGTTANAGATSVVSCFISKDTPFNDAYGTWQYNENCTAHE